MMCRIGGSRRSSPNPTPPKRTSPTTALADYQGILTSSPSIYIELWFETSDYCERAIDNPGKTW